ncbi:CDP-glycerol glycerophosphotransferase family protein [Microbacterium horticulturae]|uniref:CDP-glycerol glycerophosphotransferase family protein n=1 Tax=Microbacterium horticulturae TaxID=3028316 RepID=A0ABY8BXB6_9MICO|nr:CDP-glycerol glycerophosphotransferase family protein [Microbacterium sp. KACC 23027]WEG07486.1 CDP-glycerol glycerophosphotransferase family protein [Microbacterium sp. KACC 23027]
MASFSFSAGNAAKLVRIPLYAAGRLATVLIPRSPDEWVYGCGAGIGDGALALWNEAAARHPSVWLVGSDREERDAAALGIPTIRRHSVRGFWRTARARVVVVTHGFGDVNRYATSGAFIAQLWHGIPLKRVGIDSPETVQLPVALRRLPFARLVRAVLRLAYRRTTRQIDLIPAASHLVRGRLESAFSLADNHVPVTGEPRVDVLSQGDAAARRRAARETIAATVGDVGDRRLVLYAPTWRDGDPDAAIPDADEWEAIIAMLDARDAVLLVRSHPLGAGRYSPPRPTDRVRMLGSDVLTDVTPVLPGVDVFLTDYSSLLYDVTLIPLPSVFLAPDLESYVARRGLYGTYADIAGDDAARTWSEAVAQIDAVLADADVRERRLARARELDTVVHAHRDGRNAARVHERIVARVRAGRRAR